MVFEWFVVCSYERSEGCPYLLAHGAVASSSGRSFGPTFPTSFPRGIHCKAGHGHGAESGDEIIILRIGFR